MQLFHSYPAAAPSGFRSISALPRHLPVLRCSRQLGVGHRRRAVHHLGGVAANDVHADELALLDIIDELAEAVAHGVIS